MQLEGFLSRFALRELLELSVASLVTGAIEVQAPSGLHTIYFVTGDCVHAHSPDASGFDAIWPLFELSDAPFRVVPGMQVQERTIAEPPLQVIDKAAALARQWSTVRPHVPRLDLVPQLTMPSNGEQVRIFEEDWPILSWVDGTRTIAEIARCATLDSIEVCVGLLRLRERGLVSLLQQPTASPAPIRSEALLVNVPPDRPSQSVEQPARPSFFAKLLTNVSAAAFPAYDPPTDAPGGHVAVAQSDPSAPAEAAGIPAAAPPEQDEILRLLRGV